MIQFIERTWRGELPLWKTYWVLAFPTLLAIAAGERMLEESEPNMVEAIAWVAASLTVYAWLVVGIWRSASRYTAEARLAGKRKFLAWGRLAQLMMILGVIRTIGEYAHTFTLS